ncbi:MAG: response regulator [Magnetococcales bacterium]|nr:response regulator [Magnetococcales bacterium]
MAEILVVDDDEALGKRICALLSWDGHRVRWAVNAREGLSLHTKHPADLIVTEIYLPGMNGLELISVLRHRGDNVQIIALSRGYQRMSEELSLMLAKCKGAFAAFSKPVSVENLRSVVKAALGGQPTPSIVASKRFGRSETDYEVSGWRA